jgi:DNA uptake protein ComE-like DNA-binding protein
MARLAQSEPREEKEEEAVAAIVGEDRIRAEADRRVGEAERRQGEPDRRVEEAARRQGEPVEAGAAETEETGVQRDPLRTAEEQLEQRKAEEEQLARRLEEVEKRASEAESRAARAEQLATEEAERTRRLREMHDRIAQAEERAADAERRAREAVNRVAGIGHQGAAPPPEPPIGREGNLGPAAAEREEKPAGAATEREWGIGAAEGDRLNVNEASYEQLRDLDLSVTQAGRLLAYRERSGGFSSLDELDSIPGFSHSSLTELKRRLTI